MKSMLGKLMIAALVLALAVPIPVAGQNQTVGPAADTALGIAGPGSGYEVVDLSQAVRTKDGRVRVLIQLDDPPLATYAGGVAGLAATSPAVAGGGKLDANSPASQAYIAYLVAQQDLAAKALAAAAPSLSVDGSYQAVFNGLAAAVNEAEVMQLLKAPGVANVFPDLVRHATMDVSLDLINAPEMWAALPAGTQSEAGRGIKVAIVDSGLQSLNPMFSGAGFVMPPGYPRGYCVTNPADPDFQCNNKIIVARYFTPTVGLDVAPEEVLSPLGINGHGSHTAGTAVGNPVTVDIGDGIQEDISGVAPAAYLMVYKGLFEQPDYSGSSGTDSMLVGALNAAVLDGADVINNSWGGGPGASPSGTIYDLLLPAIVSAGVLPVFAAGNDGPGANTVGCPGCVEAALTVGASTTSRVHAFPMDVTGPAPVPANLLDMAVAPSNSPESITTTPTGTLAYAGLVDPGNELGCDPFPANAFQGKIALVSRGTCNFTDKIDNAEAAGAVALIIHNNGGGPPNIVGTAENATIPVATMALSDAQALIAFIHLHPNDTTVSIAPTIARIVKPEWEDILASFSSIGPNGDADVLKPDIVAPGVNIISAYAPPVPPGGEGVVFSFLQGTSMAAPHVTGAAALMVQLHPTWTPNEIKTALTSTANPDVLRKPNGTTPADPLDAGAGRLDLATARDAALTFDRPSMAEDDCFETCFWVRTVTNMLGDPFTWTAEVSAGEGVSLTVQPNSLTIPAGATRTFTVTVNLAGAELDGWQFGAVTWVKTGGGASDAHLPVAVFNSSSTSPGVLNKSASAEAVEVGEAYTYTINVANFEATQATVNLTDTLPSETTYVNGSATGGLVYNAGPETLTGSVVLDPVELVVEPDLSVDAPTYMALPMTGTLSICQTFFASCDEAVFTVGFAPGDYFEYLGVQYTNLSLSSNGFVVYGDSIPGSDHFINQDLPDPTVPNNLVAGFWTDLDLDGASASDSGGGDWLINDVNVGGTDYFVAEYRNAQLFGDPTAFYTFQLWFEYNSNNVWLVYDDLTGDTSVGTVGAENATGEVGDNYYFDGAGTLPAAGDSLIVRNTLDTHTFTYAVTVDAGTQPGTLIKNRVEATSSALPGVVFAAVEDVRLAFLEIFLPIIAR